MSKDKKKVRNIGIPNITPPDKTCEDPNCPFHGHLPVRGRMMEGTVTSMSMYKTITIQTDYFSLVRKYSRFERRRSKKAARVPDCLDVQVGDTVKVIECRPLSKTVKRVVVSVSHKSSAVQEAE